jgi:hypothetical protein
MRRLHRAGGQQHLGVGADHAPGLGLLLEDLDTDRPAVLDDDASRPGAR